MSGISRSIQQKVIQILGRLNSNEAKDVLNEIRKSDWRTIEDKSYLLVAFIPEDATLNMLTDLLPKIQKSLNELTDNRPPIVSVHPEKGTRLFIFRSNKARSTIWDKLSVDLHGTNIRCFVIEVGDAVSNSCFSEEGWQKVCKMVSTNQ